MKRSASRLVVLALFALAILSSLGLQPATAQESRAVEDAENLLYKNMYDGGLITEEEYEYVIEHGSLPKVARASTASTAVEERQSTIEKKAVRLSYRARRNKIRARLTVLAERLRTESRAKRQAAEEKAAELGLPLREELPDGTIVHLIAFEHGMPRYYATDNAVAADTISTDEVWPTGGSGFALTGSPITLGMWDGGAVRTTHQEFSGRVTQMDSPASVIDHSTAVAGTMIATGVQATAKGASFQGQLHAYDFYTNFAEIVKLS